METNEAVNALKYLFRHTYTIQFIFENEAIIRNGAGDPIKSIEDIKKIRDYCDFFLKNNSQDDLDKICKEIIEERKLQTPTLTQKCPVIGNVYLMANKLNGFIKIGFTKNSPVFRERTLQSEDPNVELIKYWPNSTMKDEEKLHEIFHKKRIRGEWFALDKGDISKIKQYFTSKEVAA